MYRHRILVICCLYSLLNLNLAIAKVTSVIETLYSDAIPVISQEEGERTQAINQAFVDVLKKVSGEASIAEKPGIQAALRTSENYVLKYSYQASTDKSKPFVLKLEFDPESIDQLLLQEGYAAVGNDNADHIKLTVNKINTQEDYLKVQDYLQHLAGVKAVEVTGVRQNQIHFEMEVEGGRLGLVQALSAEPRLQPVNMNEDNSFDRDDTELMYQWTS